MGLAARRDTWRAIAANKVSVLVGARSALFLPWQDLGLIIIDEEHDAGFKQEDGVIYNARDMAVVRARFADCPIILSSATPSLETYVNASQKRYQRHILPHRHGTAQLPTMALVDMRQSAPPRGQWLAPIMREHITQSLAAGEQSLLFLNRRGYAPLMLCRACGHRYACATCDAWMVAHMGQNKADADSVPRYLECHHCGSHRPLPQVCEKCQASDKIAACGPGVERIHEEVRQLFPEARTAILSSDHSGGMEALRAQIEAIAAGAIDIIIGTQIVAKGHHFPHLSFVGVVDADLGLTHGDLRAGERTYQILSQVAGRSGRAQTSGQALLQSYMPEHPVLQALVAGDRDAFFDREAAARAQVHMPPFGRLAALIITAPAHESGWQFCRQLARHIPPADAIRVLGPAPAPMARLRGRYRFRFLVKSSGENKDLNQKKGGHLQAYISHWLGRMAVPHGVRVHIDIDPYRFF